MLLRSNSSDFSDGGFGSFTEADYALIDAASNAASSSETTPKGGPKIEIVVEDDDVLPEAQEDTRSMYERFRQYQRLSVSDLVGPAWCEVQFEYGLLQKRSRRLAHRPVSFVSRNGKVMSVKKDVAAVNDEVQRRGTFVHKELERELNPEKVPVQANTNEENWGLRIVNMLSSIHTLLAVGSAREMPVFGFVQGIVVTGIIDELIRDNTESPHGPKRHRSPASTPRKCQKRRQVFKPSEGQSLITNFVSSSDYIFIDLTADEEIETEGPKNPRFHQHTLRLIDTKTRRSESLPSDEDALSSRLQLMLYHRLLSSLISTETPFDFTRLWEQTNVDPALQLSESFLAQFGISPYAFTCLDDLTALWRNTTLKLDIPGIDPCLQLIYRAQQSLTPKEDITSAGPLLDPSISQFLSGTLNQMLDLGTEEVTAELLWALQQSQLMHLNNLSGKGGSNEPSASKVVDRYKTIGIKEFNLNDECLDSYLASVLDWWMGRRPPRGVSETQTRRCNSCEYMSDCEWRKKRASEIQDRAC
ncbi:exonuclease V [Armillaria novae-zelandiae]|uniref:Exonuclease V n=1 Tax=Armillaria novae-zelandiae TaxID=153914 RepID=A0AA39PEG2_9AGAR|nr:exonuclease V [Armillaria novae-zelandiae]